MKIKKCHLILILTFVCISLIIVFSIFPKEQQEKVNITKTEQQAIEFFYNDDYGNVAKGKTFDVKYAYYDPINISDNTFEIVKKKQIKTKIDAIDILTQSGDNYYGAFNCNFYYDLSPKVPSYFASFDEGRTFKLYGITNFSLLNVTALHNEKLKQGKPVFHEEVKHITLILNVNGEEEKYTLTCDTEQQFEIAKRYKNELFSGKRTDEYAHKETGYYFGFLFRKNFDQWYEEMKSFPINEVEKDYLDWNIMTHLTYYANSKEELKTFLQLSEEQFLKYLEVLECLKEEDTSMNYPKYLFE